MDEKLPDYEKWLGRFYELYEADTEEDQKEILQKMYGDSLTPEQMNELFPDD